MSYSKIIRDYLYTVEAAHTHAGKLIAFSELLKLVFGVSSYEIVPNVERYVKTGGLLALKGRMDMHLGQTIIEVKVDLTKELDTAIEEIERYTAILRKNGQKVAQCIVTDGKKFKVFVVRDQTKEVRRINFEEVTPEQAIMFLDTFLFSGRKVPTATDLNMRFGPGSPIFEEVTAELSILFNTLKDPVKFDLWSKNMQLVYGTVPAEEAFVAQTYLMMLVRLLLARHLLNGKPPALESLDGKLFESQGIKIIEEDFFSWILSPLFWSQFKPLVDTITDALDMYDLEAVDEDIFKEIYQEIIKRGERHRIGEYYTPEWLAELTLNEAIATLDPKGKRKLFSILDPACGSGTFLTNAIAFLKRRGCSLKEILNNVYGIDLNPLAVAISRANYLLALGKRIEKRKRAIFIPVYMADSIKLPRVRKELIYGVSILAIDVDEKTQLNLPLEIALDENKLKKVLTIFASILSEYRKKRISSNQALNIFDKSHACEDNIMPILKDTIDTIMNLIDKDRDSIWVFMMRNIYAPLRLREKKFDIVIGNPPWVSLRYIETPHYQSFLKKTVFKYGLLTQKETDLFTQMDTSTVFYVKAADTYLSENGVLAFVMPRSVLTGAKQHETFKKQRKPTMKLVKILDTEKVSPLFNVDSCSLIAKAGKATIYPVPCVVVSGVLQEKNMRLDKAREYLAFDEAEYSPPRVGVEKSYYHDKVLEGACIVPRTLWFIEFITDKFGLNPYTPSVKSLILPNAKDPWKKVIILGQVEKKFIFATLTGKNLLPFKPQFLPIILPIRSSERSWIIFPSKDLRSEGEFKVAEWVDSAQRAWQANATKTSKKNFPNAMDYVNYRNKLVVQKKYLRYYIVYTGSGSHIAAAVVDTSRKLNFHVGKAKIPSNGFVADYTTFWFGTNDAREAHYLTAVLNSNILDQMIKEHQPKGKFGPRHICRLPFEFNVPKFNPENRLHRQIAAMGLKATKEAANLPRMSRLKTKAAIPSMKDIDKLVLKLLK